MGSSVSTRSDVARLTYRGVAAATAPAPKLLVLPVSAPDWHLHRRRFDVPRAYVAIGGSDAAESTPAAASDDDDDGGGGDVTWYAGFAGGRRVVQGCVDRSGTLANLCSAVERRGYATEFLRQLAADRGVVRSLDVRLSRPDAPRLLRFYHKRGFYRHGHE